MLKEMIPQAVRKHRLPALSPVLPLSFETVIRGHSPLDNPLHPQDHKHKSLADTQQTWS
uniref:Uncharacterized protein n=1 Tax=Anguilla anguilla TaxID=7936 RepID=A0A0E9X1A3_ANGAN